MNFMRIIIREGKYVSVYSKKGNNKYKPIFTTKTKIPNQGSLRL